MDQANAPLSPTPPTSQNTHRRENLIAGGLLCLCLFTAVGNWVFGFKRPQGPEATKTNSPGFQAPLLSSSDIGIIPVEGTIMYKSSGGGLGGNNIASSERINAALHQAEKDGVKGILLQINSPGGSASASQSIYEEIRRIKQRSKIKVVAAMGDVAASGGYYIASAADLIIANPSTLTGSIGVISQFTNIKGLYEKVGLQSTVIKSGKFKDIGSPHRQTTEEERQLLQNLINDTYDQFLDAVAQGRKMTKTQVKPLADGRIYTGRQAYKVKLVDRLGDYNVALDTLKKMTQVGSEAKVKDYLKPSLNDWISSLGAQSKVSLNPLDALPGAELQHLNKVPLMLYQ